MLELDLTKIVRRVRQELTKIADAININSVAISSIKNSVFHEEVVLNGTTETRVSMEGDLSAELDFGAGTWASDDAETLILNDETFTILAEAGFSQGADGADTDISGGADSKFKISVDGDEAEEVELDLTSLDSGAAIAAEMQTKIRALEGNKTGVVVEFNSGDDNYKITSGTKGSNSSVVITRADSSNVTEELKIGQDGEEEVQGTGNVGNAAAVTAEELAEIINDTAVSITAYVDVNDELVILSDDIGKDAEIEVGDGDLNTELDITNGDLYKGAQGLDIDEDLEHVITQSLNTALAVGLKDVGYREFTLVTTDNSTEEIKVTVYV